MRNGPIYIQQENMKKKKVRNSQF